MRTLSHEELNSVSGADLAGAFIGMLDGAATGMAIVNIAVTKCYLDIILQFHFIC